MSNAKLLLLVMIDINCHNDDNDDDNGACPFRWRGKWFHSL